MRHSIQQADVILSLEIEHGEFFTGVVIEKDARGNPLTAERGVFHTGFRQLRKIQIQILKGFQSFIQSHSELLPLTRLRQATSPPIRQKETVDHNGIFPRKNLCTKNIEPAFGEHAGNATEQTRPIPSANTDIGAATIRISFPNHRRIQHPVFVQDLLFEKIVYQLDVLHDFIRGHRPEITWRQIIKVRLDFFIGQSAGNQLARLGFNFIAVLLFRPRSLGVLPVKRVTLPIQSPLRDVLKPVPQIIRRAQ